jgi:hypothetical protein
VRVRIGAAVVVGLLLIAGTPVIAGAAPTPADWCGPGESATDLPDAVTSYQVHVIYAIAADGPDNFGSRVTPIARDLAIGDSWWQSQDPTRTPRFDMAGFPGCDSTFGNLDISSVRLLGTAADYSALDAPGALRRVRGDLLVSFPDVHKKYLVYLDTPVATDKCGTAVANQTTSSLGVAAVVFLQPVDARGCGISALGTGAYPAETAFHEIVHSLGVPATVAAGAPGPPNLCDGHVCDDPQDIMRSGGVAPSRLSAKLLDSGHDDYYGHAGSWWDVRNSPWVAHLDTATAALTVTTMSGGHITADLPGLACSTTCTSVWDAGTRVGVQAIADAGYVFVGWGGGGCSGEISYCGVTMIADVSVSARFGLPGIVGVRIVGHGSVNGCSRQCTEAMVEGNEITLKASPRKGDRFVRWGGACRGTRRQCTLVATPGMIVRAVFAGD